MIQAATAEPVTLSIQTRPPRGGETPAAAPAPTSAEQRRTHVLARMSQTLAILYVVFAIPAGVFGQGVAGSAVPLVLVIGTFPMWTAYVLAVGGRHRLGATLCIGVNLAIPLVIFGLLDHTPALRPFDSLAWLLISVLLASTFGSVRTTIITGGVAVAATLVIAIAGPGAWTQSILTATLFLVATTTLMTVFHVHRDHVDHDRAAELRGRSQEVEIRTTELVAAYDALRNNQDALLTTEKMASLGRLTAGIAYHMASPLAATRLSLSSALGVAREYASSIDDPQVGADDHRAIARELAEAITMADAATDRVASFVRSIRAQIRGPSDRRRTRFDGVAAVRDALHLLGHAAVAASVKVDFKTRADHAALDGDPGAIVQIVTNLVANAIDATAGRGGGTVEVDLVATADKVVLRVSDDGLGIPTDVLPRIFEPLFTTKLNGTGAGLGLAIVHDIVRGEFQGAIAVESTLGAGATFTVTLPRAMEY